MFFNMPLVKEGEDKNMRRRTTTQKLRQAITNNLLHITKVEVYYKTSKETETIDTDKFYENFSFLCESGCFMDALGWHYERNLKENAYIAECGRMDPDSEVIISVYLSVCEDVKTEDVDEVLRIVEEE